MEALSIRERGERERVTRELTHINDDDDEPQDQCGNTKGRTHDTVGRAAPIESKRTKSKISAQTASCKRRTERGGN